MRWGTPSGVQRKPKPLAALAAFYYLRKWSAKALVHPAECTTFARQRWATRVTLVFCRPANALAQSPRLFYNPTPMPFDTTSSAARTARLENVLRTVIRGQDEIVRLALVALFGRGHLLVEGVPGVGKTTLAQALSRALDCSFQRIQFTSDMLPSDVLGISLFSPNEQRFEFKRGPVFTHILLADEINRTTPKTQSALLEAMNEGQVTLDSRSYPLPQPFLVIATQNPVEHHGTYPLPESQMDRFLMRVRMTYPESESERAILRSEAGAARLDGVQPVLTSADVLAMQNEVSRVRVDDALVDYTLEIVARTRDSEYLTLGVSPRGAMMLYRAAQAMAYVAGREFTTPEDFKTLAVPVFAHRTVVNARYSSTRKKSEQADQILRDIVESVPVPV